MRNLTKGVLGLVGGLVLAGCHPNIDCNSYEARENFKRIQEYDPNDEVDAAFVLFNCFEYKPDNGFLGLYFDYWQSPRQTVARLEGDCDDFAFLAALLGEKLGYKSQLLSMSSLFDAHMLALLYDEKTGKYGVLGRCNCIEPAYDSIDSLILDGINPNSDGNFTHYKVINPCDINKDWRTICEDLTITVNPFTLKKIKR